MSTETAVDSSNDKPTTVGMFLLFFIVAVIITVTLHFLPDTSKTLNWKNVPIFFAPIFTLATSASILFPYMFPKDQDKAIARKEKIFSGVCLFLTFILCEVLILSKEVWNLEVGIIIVLFSIYLCWDFCLYRKLPEEDIRKSEVMNGSLFINIPTVIISVLAYLYLLGVTSFELVKDFDPELYASGLITFHLGVASSSYLIVSNSTSVLKRIQNIGAWLQMRIWPLIKRLSK